MGQRGSPIIGLPFLLILFLGFVRSLWKWFIE